MMQYTYLPRLGLPAGSIDPELPVCRTFSAVGRSLPPRPCRADGGETERAASLVLPRLAGVSTFAAGDRFFAAFLTETAAGRRAGWLLRELAGLGMFPAPADLLHGR